MSMFVNQRTIATSVSFSGVGLHTGNASTITFHPAPDNYGYRFVRSDVLGSPEIPALVDFVVDISRGTTLCVDDVRVHTVEHVLAALVGMEIDNCRIELSANEPPVGDGSAQPFVEVLKTAGIVEQSEPRDYLVVTNTIRYVNEEKEIEIVALPNEEFRITVMIDYNNPALGSQHTGLFNLEKEFASEFSSARTFCFLSEVEMLREQGLIKGGAIDNAIVIVDRNLSGGELEAMRQKLDIPENLVLGENGILNNNLLRFRNEPARHKLLDMLGDLALIGVRIKGQILAARPGHAANIEFARVVRKLYLQQKLEKKNEVRKTDGVVMDIQRILEVMPHRYPILLVDRITDYDQEAQRIVGIKNITFNEPVFNGHFPGRPIFPGVLQLEALAQTGGLLMLNTTDIGKDKLVFFTGIKNAKFRKPVVPGDQLVMEVVLTNRRSSIFMLTGKGYVNGKLVVEAEMQAAIVDREQK